MKFFFGKTTTLCFLYHLCFAIKTPVSFQSFGKPVFENHVARCTTGSIFWHPFFARGLAQTPTQQRNKMHHREKCAAQGDSIKVVEEECIARALAHNVVCNLTAAFSFSKGALYRARPDLAKMRSCALLPSTATTGFGFPWYGTARWRISKKRRQASSIKTPTHLFPSAAIAFSTQQRVRSFLRRRRKNANNNRAPLSPCFNPSHSSSAVWYGGSSEQTSRKTPDAAATVFSRSTSFRRGIVAVKNKCVTVSA